MYMHLCIFARLYMYMTLLLILIKFLIIFIILYLIKLRHFHLATIILDNLYKEKLPNVGTKIKQGLQTGCRLTTLARKFPIISWLPKYETRFLLQDFIAGFTVGLTTIPQAIAYGVVAGLAPQYGLYSAFMGCFTYIFFGSCKDVTIGEL